mmetsp:Transcript_91472/g.244937  ORF Transcript_91472/g.244937 Transcript_91472/m.244937 type:complete len:253 (+) Transcript_91472:747-1505(+)
MRPEELGCMSFSAPASLYRWASLRYTVTAASVVAPPCSLAALSKTTRLSALPLDPNRVARRPSLAYWAWASLVSHSPRKGSRPAMRSAAAARAASAGKGSAGWVLDLRFRRALGFGAAFAWGHFCLCWWAHSRKLFAAYRTTDRPSRQGPLSPTSSSASFSVKQLRANKASPVISRRLCSKYPHSLFRFVSGRCPKEIWALLSQNRRTSNKATDTRFRFGTSCGPASRFPWETHATCTGTTQYFTSCMIASA